MSWYALEVTSSKTFEVRDEITKLGHAAYVPWAFEWKRNAHRKRVKVPMPLVPGYVFAQIPTSQQRTILDLDHVHRFIAFGGPPLVISERDMEWVLNLTPEQVDACVKHYTKRLKPGIKAEIVEGPFAGHLVDITDIRNERARVIFHVLGSQREITIPTESMEAA